MTDWKPTDTSDKPRAATIRTIPFDESAVDIVAETLAALQGLADFRLPSSRVWQVTVPGGDEDRPTAMLKLWPGIKRVDAVNGGGNGGVQRCPDGRYRPRRGGAVPPEQSGLPDRGPVREDHRAGVMPFRSADPVSADVQGRHRVGTTCFFPRGHASARCDP